MAGGRDALAAKLTPDLPQAVDAETGLVELADGNAEPCSTVAAGQPPGRIHAAGAAVGRKPRTITNPLIACRPTEREAIAYRNLIVDAADPVRWKASPG